MSDTLEPPSEVRRDRWGRPLIEPEGGGKAVGYTRVSTLAKALDDTTALTNWKVRMALTGASLSPAMLTNVAAHRGDESRVAKKALDNIGENAVKLGQGVDAAERGTSYHKLCERMDNGEDLGPLPEGVQRDLAAYKQLIAACEARGILAPRTHAEVFVVDDDRQVAGTFDRLSGPICDLKTGKSVDFGGLAWSIQLAQYRRGRLYDPATAARHDLFAELGTPNEVAYVIHLPAGTGQCSLYEVDLSLGRRWADLALDVRMARKAGKNALDHVHTSTAPPLAIDPLLEALKACTTQAEVEQFVATHGVTMTPEHYECARIKWAALQ